jgi:hypothetical protein
VSVLLRQASGFEGISPAPVLTVNVSSVLSADDLALTHDIHLEVAALQDHSTWTVPCSGATRNDHAVPGVDELLGYLSDLPLVPIDPGPVEDPRHVVIRLGSSQPVGIPHFEKSLRTSSTFSCDIAYSFRPTVLRACCWSL